MLTNASLIVQNKVESIFKRLAERDTDSETDSDTDSGADSDTDSGKKYWNREKSNVHKRAAGNKMAGQISVHPVANRVESKVCTGLTTLNDELKMEDHWFCVKNLQSRGASCAIRKDSNMVFSCGTQRY